MNTQDHTILELKVIDLECENEKLKNTLNKIVSWDSHTVKFSVDFGSNGVRDYYRSVAAEALSKC